MRHLYYLVALTVLNHVSMGAARIVTSLYALRLEASPAVIGVLIALFAILPMFLSVAAGRLSDRIGPRTPMMAGSLVLAIGAVLPFLIPGLPTLFVSSTLIGTGFVLYQVTVQHVIGFFGKPEDRTRNFSYFAIGMSISGLGGPIIAGFGFDSIGPTKTFLLVSVLPLIPLVIVALNKLRLPAVPHADASPGKRKVFDLFRDRRMRWVFAVTTLLAMAWDLYQFVMPIYGTQVGLSASRIGLVMGAFSAATFLIRLALPAIVRHMSPWAMLSTALLLAAVMFSIFPFISSFGLLAATSFALGLGLGSSQPTVMSLLHNAAPPGRAGEAVGMRATMINFSQTTLPLVFGGIGAAVGIGPVFWVMAASLVWGGLVARRRAQHERR